MYTSTHTQRLIHTSVPVYTETTHRDAYRECTRSTHRDSYTRVYSYTQRLHTETHTHECTLSTETTHSRVYTCESLYSYTHLHLYTHTETHTHECTRVYTTTHRDSYTQSTMSHVTQDDKNTHETITEDKCVIYTQEQCTHKTITEGDVCKCTRKLKVSLVFEFVTRVNV